MKLIFEEIREDISAVEYHGKPSQSAAHIKAYFDKELQVLVVDCTAQVQRLNGSYRTINELSSREMDTVRPNCYDNTRSTAIRRTIKIAEQFYRRLAEPDAKREIAELDTPDKSDASDPNECPF